MPVNGLKAVGTVTLQKVITMNQNPNYVTKSDYNEPKPKLGNLIADNPLDLLCIDFTKVDPSRTSKENVLVMTDAFTKFSQAIVTPNQKALTVAKVLVDKWFYVYGI